MHDSSYSIEPFYPGSSSHFAALIVLAILAAVTIISGRKEQSRRTPDSPPGLTTRLLAYACLAGIVFSYIISLIDYPGNPWPDHLPLHFCDVMSVACAWALLTSSRSAKAIAFFCVLCASAQALITPNLKLDFPSLTWYSFFLSHGVTVIAAIYLVAALKWRPRKFDFLIAQAFGISYLLLIHPVNLWLDTNFGFTRFIPENGSVLSFLGPWPWYLFTMQIPAFIVMAILNIIFYKRQPVKTDTMSH